MLKNRAMFALAMYFSVGERIEGFVGTDVDGPVVDEGQGRMWVDASRMRRGSSRGWLCEGMRREQGVVVTQSKCQRSAVHKRRTLCA